jgi:hypothetical protein
MMKEEFERLTGIQISAKEYEPIEREYMDAPEGISKQNFAAEWMRKGGVLLLLKSRRQYIEELEASLRAENKRYDAIEADYNLKVYECEDKDKTIATYKGSNFELNRDYNEKCGELREIADALKVIRTFC